MITSVFVFFALILPQFISERSAEERALLEVQGVSKTFNAGTLNEVPSLRGVNLVLDPGSWVIIIGTNGSGKSTLPNGVAGNIFL